jgi:hypothetical protein
MTAVLVLSGCELGSVRSSQRLANNRAGWWVSRTEVGCLAGDSKLADAARKAGDESPQLVEPGNECGATSLRGTVKLSGRLGRRYQLNLAYLHHLYDDRAEEMLLPYRHRGAGKDWDGEYAGKWLDAASLAAAGSGDQALKEKANQFAVTLASLQAANGYLGIDTPEQRFKSGWDVWNEWNTIYGLLTNFEEMGQPASLSAATKAGDWLVKDYVMSDAVEHGFFRGAVDGGCNVDLIDQLVRLYGATGQKQFLDFVQAVDGSFPAIKTMRESGKAVETHPYVLLAYLGGVVELGRVQQDSKDLPWVESVWQDIVTNHLYPTGSLGLNEHLGKDAPNDQPDVKHQETCATVEWLIFNHRLYCVTGKARYAQALEDSIYNALLAAQSDDGMKWMYYTPLRYHKNWFSGPTKCCYWSGPKGIARLPLLVYATDGQGLRVNLFEESEATLNVQGQPVTVKQKTLYPAEGRMSLQLGLAKPAEFTVSLRVPPWAKGAQASVNGKPANVEVRPGDYCHISRKWSSGDAVALRFDVPTYLRPLRTEGVALVRGPEVMSLDSRDNPKLDVDTVKIPAGVHLRPLEPVQARRRYIAKVIAQGQPQEVVFTPYADAGNDGATFRTVFPTAK